MEDNFYKTSSERLFPRSDKMLSRLNAAQIAYDKESPVISEVITELERDIEFFKSVGSIKTVDDPEQFMREVAVNKMVAAILESKVKRLKMIKEVYGEKKKK